MTRSGFEVGSRVFAVRNTDEKNIYVYGEGVYAGDLPRPGSFYPESVDDIDPMLIELAEKSRTAGEADGRFQSLHLAEIELMRKNGKSEDEITAYRETYEARAARPLREQAEEIALAVAQTMCLNPRIDLDNGGTVWGYECWWGPKEKFQSLLDTRTVVEVSPRAPA
jgi:hypothetical protein